MKQMKRWNMLPCLSRLIYRLLKTPVLSSVTLPSPDLVGRCALVFLLLEPVLLHRGGLTGGRLALHLNPLGLVGLQVVGEVGLLGRLRRLGSGEFVDMGLGVAGLDGLGLEGTELAEVQLLNGVGCTMLDPAQWSYIIGFLRDRTTYPDGRRRSGKRDEGQPQTVAEKRGRAGSAAGSAMINYPVQRESKGQIPKL